MQHKIYLLVTLRRYLSVYILVTHLQYDTVLFEKLVSSRVTIRLIGVGFHSSRNLIKL